MVEYKYNQPYYRLQFSELNEDAVQVLSFEGEEQISRLFEYRFELLSEDAELDAKSILNKKATFIITRGDEEPIKINGIISHFEQRGRTPDYVSYYAVLVPKMWRLNLTYQNEVYQFVDIEKLVTQVLETAGFSGQDFKFNLNESYPELEYVVQYHETNFNFINRRLEHFGIFYYFEHTDDNDVIIFTDSNDAISDIEQTEDINYNPNKDQLGETETISELTCQEQVVTGLVRLKDYNYLYPEKQLMAESQIDSDLPGMYYDYGDNFQDEKQAEFLAKIRNEEFLSRSKIFKGSSDCRLFRVGFKFKMGKHYREEWNDFEYILTKLVSRGTQRGLFGILPSAPKILPTYENYFEAIPLDIKYRPPRRTPIPRIPGVMSAKLESGIDDEYAFIDDHGRYRAKMLFDLTDLSNGEATLPIRLSQAYSGSGYGMHFPNHAGIELLWACVDGDVDRPIGLGTVPNPSNTSPSTSDNKAQSVIRTAGQNELTFDDKTGSENILMKATKDHTVTVANDEAISVGNNQSISVKNDRTLSIDNNDTQTVKAKRDITVEGDKSEAIKGTNTLKITGDDTETFEAKRTITVGADDKETYGAKRTISVAADDDETFSAKRTISVSADDKESYGAKRTVSVSADDSESYGANRKIQVSSNDELTVAGNITINATGKISATGNGNVEISGPKISITGQTEITITVGPSSIKISPQGVEISGLKITSAAQTMNEISGATVKLN